jgi:glycosyltransferase involved in cell wall biosynthesis
MKIAIDVSPLQSGHKIRGVGFYLEYLKQSLLEYFPQHTYVFFTDKKEIDKTVDIVHYPYFDPFFLTLPSKNEHKTVVTVHDLTPLVFPKQFPTGLKGNIKWHLQKNRLKKVDGIIADSIASKNDIIKIAGVAEDKISVAYLAAGNEFQRIGNHALRIKELQKKYDLQEKFILYVGDVTWNKNLPRFVKAMKEAGLPLVMVGKSLVNKDFDRSNPWNKDLVTVQELVSGSDKIKQLGFVPTEDLVQLYNIATVFVFPSVYEGFGLPVLEAMQSGCPVVTTQGGSLKEVAGDAAVFVDGYDVEQIATEVKRVFDSSTLQKTLRDKGLQQVKKFDWKKTAEATVAVYEKVLLEK